MQEIFLTKAEKTYNKYVKQLINQNKDEETAFVMSLNTLILANNLVAKEGTFVTDITNWLNENVIYKINHCDLKYIEMVDNIFSNLIQLTNYYKAGFMTNHRGTKRDADLNYGQEEEIDKNMVLIKRQLEYLTKLCFSDTINGLWEYHSKNIHVDLFKISKNSNINLDDKIKSLKIGNHEAYVQFGNCLNSIKSIDGSNNINLQLITWIYSPWYHHHILNHNYTSNYMEIKIFSDNLKELTLSQCKDDSTITFYLKLINPLLTDIINNNRFHFKEGNVYKSDDAIFTEPKYVLDDGSISDMSLEERRSKYYFLYLLIFKTLNEANRELITNDGILYVNLEDNSYFKCSSNHLSDYILTYEYNPKPDKLAGRFYFLNHPKLYFNSKNLKGNFGFYLVIIIISLYFINFGAVKGYLIMKKKKLGNKNFLLIEDFLMKYVYPYGNEENFFVNKDNLKKIYDHNMNFKRDKIEEKINNIMRFKENNNNIDTEKNKLNKEENRKNDNLEEDNFINFGDIKNRKLYEKYYKKMNEGGYNDNDKIITIKKETRSNRKNKKESIFTNGDNEIETSHKKSKRSKIINNKEKKIEKANDEVDDIYIHDAVKEEVKEANEYNSQNKLDLNKLIHDLQISNENLRVKTISQLKISFCTFLLINLKNRIIFINTFIGNYTYSASIKALCFPLYLEILLFINTFLFIVLEDESNYSDYIKEQTGDFIWRCLLPVILVNVYFYLTRYFYNLNNGKLRKLLFDFKTNKKAFDKQYFYVLKKIKRIMIIETILFFTMAVLTYIFSFGLFTVYPSQGKSMIVSLIFGLVIDFGLYFFLELLLAIFIIFKKNQNIVIIIDYLNRLLSYKMLSP